jgi:hypothetical protein
MVKRCRLRQKALASRVELRQEVCALAEKKSGGRT